MNCRTVVVLTATSKQNVWSRDLSGFYQRRNVEQNYSVFERNPCKITKIINADGFRASCGWWSVKNSFAILIAILFKTLSGIQDSCWDRFFRFMCLSFFLYMLPDPRLWVLSAGVLCTFWDAGWKPTSNHIYITVGFFNMHNGWHSLHRGHPVHSAMMPIPWLCTLTEVEERPDPKEDALI